jgi:signal transduction histidine kinase
MRDLIDFLFATGQFMSHGHCYLWNPALVRVHLLSDLSIGLAYVAISLTLLHLVYRARRDIPFHWMLLAFGAFIIACGGTHLMEVWTIWTPVYWASGGVKVITALASVATAIVLPPLVPKTLRLIQNAKLADEHKHKLEAAHHELERLYEEMKRADALKTQFFANVSHELRTPVALILGPVEKLIESGEVSPRQIRELQVVERNARTLLTHINGLLDLSKLESGRDELREGPVDLAAALRLNAANFEVLAAEHDISLTVEAPQSLTILADPEKLQRVFVNLLANAFKFAPAGGVIQCRAWIEGGRVFTTVRDNGPGVPANLRSAIFERFRQGEDASIGIFGGTGLGLTIAKEFVELHGGSISVGDSPGEGALFTVELPFKPAAAGQRPLEPSEGTVELARNTIDALRVQKTAAAEPVELPAPFSTTPGSPQDDRPLVLVVEDNQEMSRFIADTLTDEYRIAFARDGQAGLEKASLCTPNLILCDVMMPKMSGDALARELRARQEFASTPIVMLTAKADDALRLELLEGLVQDFITKPVGGAELRARIRNLIAIQKNDAALRHSQKTLRALTARLVSAQEQERSRLARELHDGLNQWLVALSLEIGALQDRLADSPDGIRSQLAKLEAKAVDISEEVRRISHRLHPAALEHVGLVTALRSYCAEFSQQAGVKTEFSAQDPPEVLSPEASTCLFRITQEALSNVAKHSQAAEARLTLRRVEGEIQLLIVDAGVGFQVDPEQAKGGLGLVSMDERCRALGGTLSVTSIPRQGTTVEARIPLPHWRIASKVLNG